MVSALLVYLRNQLHELRVSYTRIYYNLFWGMRIGKGTRIARTAKLDKTNPRGISVGEYTSISFEAAIIAHDYVRDEFCAVEIGSFCFIGARSIILPGVTIGDHCVVAAGSVVMRDVPPRSVVAGNPARLVEQGIETGPFGVRAPRNVVDNHPEDAMLAPVHSKEVRAGGPGAGPLVSELQSMTVASRNCRIGVHVGTGTIGAHQTQPSRPNSRVVPAPY